MDQATQYTAKDESNDRKYFVQTPQIVWAMCDNPYEYMLWNVVKMIAAEGGECYVTTPGLARMCMMGTGTVSRARKALLDKGLLKGRLVDRGHGKAWHLSIPDLWAENVSWRQEHQSLTGRIALKPARTKEQHDEPSPLEGKPSPLERKKNPSEEEPEIPAQAQIETPVSPVPAAAVPSESENGPILSNSHHYTDAELRAFKNERFRLEMENDSRCLNAQPQKHISAEQRMADTRAASARWWANSPWGAPSELQCALKRYGDNAPALLELQRRFQVEFGLAPDWSNKRQVKSWVSGLREVWVASGEDHDVVVAAGKYLRKKGLPIATPRSLTKMARSIAAEHATAHTAPSARAVREYR